MHHFLYDPKAGLAVCKNAEVASFSFPGVFLWDNFISEEEEKILINSMDQDTWAISQSGRRKQVIYNIVCPNVQYIPNVNDPLKILCYIKNIMVSSFNAGLWSKSKLQEKKSTHWQL